MGYDSWSGNTWGIPTPALPAMSGALHPKYVNTPMNPGLMVRAFEQDPFSGNRNVEQPLGQNHILTSGTTLPANNPGQFFDPTTNVDFTLPAVVPEFVYGSGLPGAQGWAYPALTHNNGVSASGTAQGTFPLPDRF